MDRVVNCIFITAIMWLIARVVPGIVSLLGISGLLISVIWLLMLFAGWYVANRISEGENPVCVKVNLLIFALLESGAFPRLINMVNALRYNSGRYAADVNGILYSDYPRMILITLVYVIAYYALCIVLAIKTDEDGYLEEENVEESAKSPVPQSVQVPQPVPQASATSPVQLSHLAPESPLMPPSPSIPASPVIEENHTPDEPKAVREEPPAPQPPVPTAQPVREAPPAPAPQRILQSRPARNSTDIFANIPDLLRTKYEEDRLYVEFPAGNIVMYKNVPEEKYQGLREASQKNKYLFNCIMGEHEAEQVKGVL